MALNSLTIYQDIKNPDNLQLVASEDTAGQLVKSLTQAEYQQLQALGVPEGRTSGTYYQGIQLTSLDQLKYYASTPPKYPNEGTPQAWSKNPDKWRELLKNVDFASLPTTGFTPVTPSGGAGSTPFRARQEGEDMTAYLQAKQAYEIQTTGTSGVQFGSTQNTTLIPPIAPTISSISSANIQPSSEIPFKSPEESSVYDITKLNNYSTPPLEITEPEKKAQTLTEQLQALNLSLIGESAYKTEKETEQDIVGLTKTKTDLSNQLKILQNEALAIPQQMQVEATGRGITAGGLKPLETARLRTNAIAALGVSAMLEATNGNLATANDLVDRAVKAKFDPIREEISAKMDNLNLILKSPDYTIVEKNRAQAQKDAQDTQKAAIDQAQTETENIYKIAIKAAAQGVDAITLQNIRNAKSVIEATIIAQQAGVFAEKVTGAITTLDDLAKAGYTRRMSESGIGWAFYKNGTPISAEQISKETGVTLATLLAGSTNPADAAKIQAISPTESTKIDMTPYLANQGIPLTAATSAGKLTNSALQKVLNNGVPLEIANHIWVNMQAGNSFETIRQGMRSEGLDTTYLDKFVQALQNSGGGASDYENY